MAQDETLVVASSVVTIEITINDELLTFTESAPEGFPPELHSQLAEFWRRGFVACVTRQNAQSSEAENAAAVVDLAEFAQPLSGRPVKDEVQERGQKAAALRRKGLTYGQIAAKLCPQKGGHHRCGKRCADRIRQAARPYLRKK